MRRLVAALTAASLIGGSLPAPVWSQVEAVRPVMPASVSARFAPARISIGSLSTPSLAAAPSLLAPSPSFSAAPAAIQPAPALAAVAAAAPAPAPASPVEAAARAPAPASPVEAAAPAAAPALENAARLLSAASTPERPAAQGSEAGEEAFEAATPRPDSGETAPIAGNASTPSPVLSAPEARRAGWRRWMPDVPKPSRPLVAAAFAWNFFTIAAYSMIGPARGALLMTEFGPKSLPWVYMASAALTGLVVWGYERFSKVPRRYLVGGSLLMLAVTMSGGALAVAAAASHAVSFGYFLWTDVFGIMSVTLFWTYQNDVFRHDEAKKHFGLVAAAAPLGSLAGAWAVRHYVGAWGPTAILLAASGVFALVLPIFLFMERAARGRGAAGAKPEDAAPPAAHGILRTIVSSPFLLVLALLVGLERMVPDLTNYLYSVAATNAYAGDPAGMAAFFANVNFWTSVGSFATSSLLTGLALRRLGVGGSLMTAGLINLTLFALFPFAPGLGLAALFFGLDGVSRYTVFKTAKETTYSATNKDVIYRVKAFIEMFVYRFSRGVAGFLLLAAGWLGWGAAGAAYVGVPLALLWIFSAWRVGREYKKLDEALPPDRR
ncbi:MAG TPA: hypothetical protein VN915_09305 [Elusimicrobiota bacterium]|nr:hypothetical protein [Elusimicrobiota bacterium]